MSRLVEVKVSVYVRVPTSRKRDKVEAGMAMESKARREIHQALDLSQFVTIARDVEVDSWEVTDTVLEPKW